MTPRTEAGIALSTRKSMVFYDAASMRVERSHLVEAIVKIEDEAFEAGRLAGRVEAEGKEQTP